MTTKHVSHPNENGNLSMCEILTPVKALRSVFKVALNSSLKRYVHYLVQVGVIS